MSWEFFSPASFKEGPESVHTGWWLVNRQSSLHPFYTITLSPIKVQSRTSNIKYLWDLNLFRTSYCSFYLLSSMKIYKIQNIWFLENWCWETVCSSPTTLSVRKTDWGGWVVAWHSYNPASSSSTLRIRRFQFCGSDSSHSGYYDKTHIMSNGLLYAEPLVADVVCVPNSEDSVGSRIVRKSRPGYLKQIGFRQWTGVLN